ncbi:MAG: 5-formyltetrahydrofolate cyclo-ligase [Gallionellales bacterium GWA2_60_18]|nr:MAG: 5-formyltetrahydrofolate cyclo-ligase [Gallionellales bacterium GWA2_60_18]
MTVAPSPLKQTLRKTLIAQREQLPADIRAAHSAAIGERLLQLPEYRAAGLVLGYMNFGAEFASELWAARVLADGKRLALPKVNHHTNHLDLYLVEDFEEQLEQGLWGIREPIVERCERLDALNEVEFVLLPGVAFTRDGARLGYGGGFYDKLLARMTHRPALVAAAFALQLVEQLPQEATDIRVGQIVTERETISCPA